MKFNMGCGTNRREGYVNVDSSPACEPDQVWDLEQTPWPWADSCAEEVVFVHSLEHMGGDSKTFLALMTELYRICAPGAQVTIHVPHPRHDNFLNDPTHVRAITPAMLSLFDRQKNDEWRAMGAANTPLALYTGVDFRVDTVQTVLDEPYATRLKDGLITKEAVSELLHTVNNVATEFRIRLTAHKAVG
jgi:hypothetical protein